MKFTLPKQAAKPAKTTLTAVTTQAIRDTVLRIARKKNMTMGEVVNEMVKFALDSYEEE